METLVYRDRRGSNCVKWDVLARKYKNPDLLSMWIADMDFQSPACVTEALARYLDQGVYGYYLPPESCTQAFLQWEREKHGYDVRAEWLRAAPGVMPAVHWLVACMTGERDKIAVLTPAYPGFLPIAEKMNRELVTCDLACRDGAYSIDFQRLEDTLRQDVKLMLLCSPHNPVGRVWTREELHTILALCRRYHVFLVADEIHQDILLHGSRQVPVGGLSGYEDMVISVTAPTKTFNLAGCQYATMIIPDGGNRRTVDAWINRCGVTKCNAFSYIMAEAAYSGGRDWLDGLLARVEANEAHLRTVLARAAPEVVISPLEGTFLLWLDFRGVEGIGDLHAFLEKACGLALNYGEEFGGRQFAGFARMNLATSAENVAEAARRIAEAVGR